MAAKKKDKDNYMQRIIDAAKQYSFPLRSAVARRAQDFGHALYQDQAADDYLFTEDEQEGLTPEEWSRVMEEHRADAVQDLKRMREQYPEAKEYVPVYMTREQVEQYKEDKARHKAEADKYAREHPPPLPPPKPPPPEIYKQKPVPWKGLTSEEFAEGVGKPLPQRPDPPERWEGLTDEEFQEGWK